MSATPGTLVLLRHGESEWNAKNLFTGWVDVDLSAKGEAEARRGGELLREHGLLPDVVHTSRAAPGDPHRRDRAAHASTGTGSRCAGRGGSTSGTTARCRARTRSRPSTSTARSSSCSGAARTTRPPPPIADDDEFSQVGDPRYAALPPELRAATECLKDVVARMLPYWYDAIVPGPADRPDGARGRARQLAARAGQAPRRDLRRGDRRAEHPDRHPAALRPGRRRCGRSPRAARTSTRTPPQEAAAAVANQGRWSWYGGRSARPGISAAATRSGARRRGPAAGGWTELEPSPSASVERGPSRRVEAVPPRETQSERHGLPCRALRR